MRAALAFNEPWRVYLVIGLEPKVGGRDMFKAVGWVVGIIFLIGLLVVLGLLKWIF